METPDNDGVKPILNRTQRSRHCRHKMRIPLKPWVNGWKMIRSWQTNSNVITHRVRYVWSFRMKCFRIWEHLLLFLPVQLKVISTDIPLLPGMVGHWTRSHASNLPGNSVWQAACSIFRITRVRQKRLILCHYVISVLNIPTVYEEKIQCLNGIEKYWVLHLTWSLRCCSTWMLVSKKKCQKNCPVSPFNCSTRFCNH